MKYKNFEEFLKEKHGKQYIGLDDDMPDDYEHWLENMQGYWIELADEYGEIIRMEENKQEVIH